MNRSLASILVFASLVFATTAAAQHDHGDHHGTTEAPAAVAPTVGDAMADAHTDEHADEGHHDGDATAEDHDHDAMEEGHDHGDEAMAEDHDHDDAAAEGHDHGDDAMAEEHDHGAASANLVSVGERALMLEPMLTPDGLLRIAFTAMEGGAMHGAPLQGAVTTPSGERIAFGGDDVVTVVNTTLVEAGDYRIEGELAGEPFATRIAAYRGATDLGTEVVAFLAPAPSLANGAVSEVFTYAFDEGDNMHTRYAVDRSMAGMQHSTDTEEIELAHTHFDHAAEHAGIAGYEPAGNQASVSFAMVGEWQLGVLLGSGMTESVVFDVAVTE